MFGSYQVDYQGRKYFGNVSLREFHIFDYDGNFYLVDVERITACPLTSRLAAIIDQAAFAMGGLIPEPVMIELRRLQLIAGEEESPPAISPEEESLPYPANDEFPVKGIALFLAQACNMRCTYCYGDGGEYAGKGMMGGSRGFRCFPGPAGLKSVAPSLTPTGK